MTKEQMQWTLYAWFLLPSVIEVILIMALLGIATMPPDSFKSKKKALLLVAAFLIAVPGTVYISTLIFHSQLSTFLEATFGPPPSSDN